MRIRKPLSCLVLAYVLPLISFAFSPYNCRAADDGDSVALGQEHITLYANGVLRSGRLVFPATENGFRLKLDGGGAIVDFKWELLDGIERSRLMRTYGLEAQTPDAIGDLADGVRFTLEGNRILEGLRSPKQDKPGFKALKTGTMPLILVPESAILSEEAVQRPRTAFYSGQEIYEQWMLERPPGHNDASAHMDMARRCAKFGLFERARFHLDCAATIDKRTKETTADFRRDVVRKETEQEAQQLYFRVMAARRGGDFADALEALDTLSRCFPNSELRSHLDPLRAELEAASDDEKAHRVVSLSYAVADEMIRRKVSTRVKVDAKGQPIPTKPGKIVTTKNGDVVIGAIENLDANSGMTLKYGNNHITILPGEILKIRDTDIADGDHEADAPLDDLKAWVTDLRSPNGLKMQMLQRLAEIANLPMAKVKQTFDARLNSTMLYDKGDMKRTQSYATAHDTQYGVTSWLREGSKIGQMNPEDEERYKAIMNGGKNKSATTAGYTGDFKMTELNNNQEAMLTTMSDEPAIWWTAQSMDSKFNYVKSLAGEKVFAAMEIQKPPCKFCAGRGYNRIVGTDGHVTERRCEGCKGMSVMFKIVFH